MSVLPGLKSDHSIINLNLNTNDHKRGWGFWKFNSQLLHDKDYVDKVKVLLIRLEGELDYIQDRGLKWDATKCELRRLTVAQSYKKGKLKSNI